MQPGAAEPRPYQKSDIARPLPAARNCRGQDYFVVPAAAPPELYMVIAI
jgi:hypothetical protein